MIIIIGIGLVFYLNHSFKSKKDLSERPAGSDSFVHQINEQNKQPVDIEFPDELSESDLREAIHAMSHQKVKAKHKWTSILMTPERVDRLLTIVSENEEHFHEHYSIYKGILERWSTGDFSQADKDHNVIWSMQGGTVGIATGLLSPKEEAEFLEDRLHVEANESSKKD